ncbi:hypothetical protein QJQ45_013728 [Haematococcus lacustris]|nr:hypothetical protein QJQ45_013728 [Haematococcus lacustris]
MDTEHIRLNLLLNHEIVNVVTAIRQTARSSMKQDDVRGEPSRYDEALRLLRADIFKQKSWRDVDPMLYLKPLLLLIKTPDISGPVTGAAAVALQHILRSDLITLQTVNAEASINQVVEDATQCRFESTYNPDDNRQHHSKDELVLLNIIQVLTTAVECQAGILINDEVLCKAFQASFMLGDPVTKPKEYGEIIGVYSRQACGRMVRLLFGRLANVSANSEAAAISPDQLRSQCCHGVKAAADVLDFLVGLLAVKDSNGLAASVQSHEGSEAALLFAFEMVHLALVSLGPELAAYPELLSMVHCEVLAAMCQASVVASSPAASTAVAQVVLALYTFVGAQSIGQLEVVLQRVLFKLADGQGVSGAEQQQAALEGLLDIIHAPGFLHDMFVNCDCRLERSDLFSQLCTLLCRIALPGIKGGVGPLQAIACDGLASMLVTLAADMQELGCVPVPDPDCVHAAASVKAGPGLTLAEVDLPFFIDVWTPLVKGQPLQVGSALEALSPAAQGATGFQQGFEVCKLAPTTRGQNLLRAGEDSEGRKQIRSALFERGLKRKVALAVDHFNIDYKKGLQFLQVRGPADSAGNRLLPLLVGSPIAARMPASDLASARAEALPEEELASVLGCFLHACPGLSKGPIGEMLGEPDSFYIKVLNAYTECFQFQDLKFDAAIRLFLESFRLPGEAQKIDRIINSFGNHFYALNQASGTTMSHTDTAHKNLPLALLQGVFNNADAAYVLAYSVIMLNTDQHNSQVKKKMTQTAFVSNLRGVNGGESFPEEFLNDIYMSIKETPLRMSDSSSIEVTEQQLVALHQMSRTPRGQMVHAEPGSHLLSPAMAQLLLEPAIVALGALVDAASDPGVVSSALTGLQACCSLAAHHFEEQRTEMLDSVVAQLARSPMQLAYLSPLPAYNAASNGDSRRPDMVLGRSKKMCAVTATIASIAAQHGDWLSSGWCDITELVVVLYQAGVLPDSFCSALTHQERIGYCRVAEPLTRVGWWLLQGGLAVRPGEDKSLAVRRAAAASQAQASQSTSFLVRSITQMLGGGGVSLAPAESVTQVSDSLLSSQPDSAAPNGLASEEPPAASTAAKLMAQCSWQDLFIESHYLRQESLAALVRALCFSSGPIPRPSGAAAASTIPATGVTAGTAYTACRNDVSAGWDVSELCLELLYTLLLRNRDRISGLWPTVFDHVQSIFSHSRDVHPMLVQKAVMAVMRLCQRLLPYKPDITDDLVKGVQLVSLVDEQVASDMAPTIATEVLSLLKGAAPFLRTAQVWVALMGLLRIIQYDSSSFPACVTTLAWIAQKALSPVNWQIVVEAVADLLSRAVHYAAEVPRVSAGGSTVGAEEAAAVVGSLVQLLQTSEEWLEMWCLANNQHQQQLSPESTPQQARSGAESFKQEAWSHLMAMLCKCCKNSSFQVRTGALEVLQRAVVAVERFAVPAHVVQVVLVKVLVPMTNDLFGHVIFSTRDFQQADITVSELVRALAKLVLLYAPNMGNVQLDMTAPPPPASMPRAPSPNASMIPPAPPSQPPGPAPAAGEKGGGGAVMVGSTWGTAWRAILDCLVMGMEKAAPRSEQLAEALPETLKNCLLMLHTKGVLQPGWRDAADGSDLYHLTWRAARRVSQLWFDARRPHAHLTQPSPAQPSPAQPSPAQPSPAQPSPAQPSPAQPSPAQPSPAQPSPAQPSPAQPSPAQPSPAQPSPAQPSPAQPSPAQPSPAQPSPAQPSPAQPSPAQPSPAQPSPAQPSPAQPSPAQPSPAQPSPAQPSPAQPSPAQPSPAQPSPAQPSPAQPSPAQPSPAQPSPAQPSPAQPSPAQPSPAQPSPAQPSPAQPSPAQPSPAQPSPAQPSPAQPSPAQPSPAQPSPAQPSPAQPSPAQPSPAQPSPAQPSPAQPSPAQPSPAQPSPAQPSPAQPSPAQPSPAQPSPAQPSPAQPSPAQPSPAQPSPAQPSPAQPSPAQPSPAQPSPAQPSPAQPSPAQPSPAQPSPAQPSPAQPSPAQPSPAQPSPAQPSPAQPSPAQPSPAQPSPAQPSPAQPSPAQPSPAQPSPAQPSPPPNPSPAYLSAAHASFGSEGQADDCDWVVRDPVQCSWAPISTQCQKHSISLSVRPAVAQPSPAQPSPAQPSPAQPSPAQPSPAQPSPAQPSPAQPSPAQPSPAQPSPAQPSPAQPSPAQPSPAQPSPAQPSPAQPSPAQPSPAQPSPAQPSPAQPSPAQPSPAQPSPAQPSPAQPSPAQPSPAQPSPAQPSPAQPSPAQPSPAQPSPAQPSPAQPSPAQPSPAQPSPAQPSPAQPSPAQPSPAQPSPAQPSPAQPSPAQPSPAQPSPAQPSPAQPSPAQPSPAQPSPAQPSPAQPSPAQPSPAQPSPAQPSPAQPSPAQPSPAQPSPAQPSPAQPSPAQPSPAQPSPAQPSPAQPSPAQPSPAQPSPAQPSPAQPSPAQPSPAQPSPAQPSPSPAQPSPAQPSPAQPPPQPQPSLPKVLCRSPAQPSPAQPSPAQPSPAQPSPAQPSPAQPSSAQPSPAQPSPAQPSPAQPSPAQPSPAQPSPAQPSPAQPSPAQPSPAQPSPAQPSPAQPSPAQPSPAQPSPAQPSPAQPSPAQPSPAQPSPAQPSPAQPSPAQPSPAQPSPAQPSPAQPSPAQPSPAQPSPAQPSPAQSSPAQPSPAQPSPAQPSPALPVPVPVPFPIPMHVVLHVVLQAPDATEQRRQAVLKEHARENDWQQQQQDWQQQQEDWPLDWPLDPVLTLSPALARARALAHTMHAVMGNNTSDSIVGWM